VSAARVLIEGRVQGVGYRAWLFHEAQARGLRGWVRNRRSGDVEAVFAGEAGEIEAMIAACRNGPRLAQVEKISRFENEDEGWTEFSVRPTA
jgi:acylphosphatase